MEGKASDRQGHIMEFVYNDVQSIAQGHEDNAYKSKFGIACRHFPALLHKNGLAQTVVFYQAKGASDNGHYTRFLEGMRRALAECPVPNTLKPAFEREDWWLQIVRLDRPAYQLVTRQAMMLADWYKRYAEILLPREND